MERGESERFDGRGRHPVIISGGNSMKARNLTDCTVASCCRRWFVEKMLRVTRVNTCQAPVRPGVIGQTGLHGIIICNGRLRGTQNVRIY